MRALLTTSALAFLAACAPAEPSAQAAQPVAVSPTQFQTIKWMSGKWRGTGDGGLVFYESYRLVDDSTAESRSWADSTFARTTDSSTIALRDGNVTSGSSPNGYIVTRWSGDTIRFDPRGTTANGFIWARVDADHWTATLFWTDRAGKAQSRVYQMTRVGG